MAAWSGRGFGIWNKSRRSALFPCWVSQLLRLCRISRDYVCDLFFTRKRIEHQGRMLTILSATNCINRFLKNNSHVVSHLGVCNFKLLRMLKIALHNFLTAVFDYKNVPLVLDIVWKD